MIAQAGHYERVAREAYPYLVPPAFLSVVFWWLDYPWIAAFFLALTVCVALFFRNPGRTPPTGEGRVVSPADGVVIEVVDQARSDNLDLFPLTRVSIFMSIFNVHVNRSPLSGTVGKITYRGGVFLDARKKDSSSRNEQNSLILRGDAGTLEVVQVAGKVARRISCWVREGDELLRGQRFGLIHFGSRLDVYLPEQFSVSVAPGTRVSAGVTVIATAQTPDRSAGHG